MLPDLEFSLSFCIKSGCQILKAVSIDALREITVKTVLSCFDSSYVGVDEQNFIILCSLSIANYADC